MAKNALVVTRLQLPRERTNHRTSLCKWDPLNNEDKPLI
ncbi:hypothetical protein CCACVL1_10240 [Corchorus capsularis]|uniref:Uncharacterized protein n=1 Tax=Corchorus capsularis TaxID=210143 RepID=A0A1R3IS08_COCAP|nr:hypothetical protein CCACVL1_10240 [Corchorus capsularis]